MWTLFYPKVNSVEQSSCTVQSMQNYRAAMYAAVVASCVFLLGMEATNTENFWPLYAIAVIIAVAWVASLVVSQVATLPLATRATPKSAARCCWKPRHCWLQIASSCPSGRRYNNRWASTTNGGVRASTFAMAAVVLERHIFVTTLPPMFVASRRQWLKDAHEVISDCDRKAHVDVRRDAASFDACCACNTEPPLRH
jgi:hypothetical protein